MQPGLKREYLCMFFLKRNVFQQRNLPYRRRNYSSIYGPILLHVSCKIDVKWMMIVLWWLQD